MTYHEQLQQLIFDALDEINKQSSADHHMDKSLETTLYGEKGALDSLGLVNFIVAVEERIQNQFGFPLTLATESAMSQQNNPFRTVLSLISYLTELLEEKANGKSSSNT